VVLVVLLILFSLKVACWKHVVVFGSDCTYCPMAVLDFSENNVVFIMTAIASVHLVSELTKSYVHFICM